MAEHPQTSVDPRSGSSKSNSTFYSKRKPLALPTNHSLDITTFISSQLLAQDHDNNKVAFIDASTGRHLSFADVWKGLETVSTLLSEMGIRKGDVVLLLSPNSIFFPIVCLSVMSLGAIITPLNTAPEIAKQISDSKATLVFTIPQFLPKLSLVPEGKQPVNVVLMSNAGDSISIPDSSRIVVADTLESMMKKKLEGASGKRAVVTQDDMATLLYSSGTTGASKGVVLSHGNLIALIGMAGRFRTHEEEQIYIATIPMSHSFGFSAFVLRLLAKGCTVVVLTKFGMHEMLSAVEKYKVTYLPLVPPILVAMANHADAVRTKYNLECLRYVLCGGAPLSKWVMDLFWDKCPGITILQGYALTESAGAGASIETAEESRRYGTAGLITPSTEAKIVDTQTGEALPPNRAGELWLRGPPIMKGYFGNAEATASTLTSDGWLRTGDLCYIDDDGFVFVVDRLKELIKYKGHQGT